MNEEEVVFSDDMTLSEARLLLNMELGTGLVCPCCERPAKIRPRGINRSQVIGLLWMYKEYGREFGSLQKARQLRGDTDNREESKLRYWGLLEESREGRVSVWRVTPLGEAWIRGDVTVPSKAFIYSNKCYGHDGDEIGIFDILTEDEHKEILL